MKEIRKCSTKSTNMNSEPMCRTCIYFLEDEDGVYCDLTEEPVRGCDKACENYSEGE